MTVINPLDDNEFLWAAELNAIANAAGAAGIVSGCSISKGTGDWDIDVTSGTIFESNTQASISSGTVTITDSSALTSGQERVTLIHADTGDALASTDGTAAADPASPNIPAGEVLLGFVVVADTDNTAADSDIIDVPALMQNDVERYDVMSAPASTSAGSATLGGGWVSESATQDAFIFGQIQAERVEGTDGTVAVEVDESGGTTADYSFQALADATADGGGKVNASFFAFLPPGGQYRVVNGSDPNSGNALRFVRVMLLG